MSFHLFMVYIVPLLGDELWRSLPPIYVGGKVRTRNGTWLEAMSDIDYIDPSKYYAGRPKIADDRYIWTSNFFRAYVVENTSKCKHVISYSVYIVLTLVNSFR